MNKVNRHFECVDPLYAYTQTKPFKSKGIHSCYKLLHVRHFLEIQLKNCHHLNYLVKGSCFQKLNGGSKFPLRVQRASARG